MQGTHGALCTRENVSILMTSYPVHGVDPLSEQDGKMIQYISVWTFRNSLKSNLKKKIMKQFHTGKFISRYHLETGTILSHPQSIAAET